MDESVESFEWNYGFFRLELSCLLKEFVNLKKIVKNKFLNRPSLTNPNDNDDEANKKYVNEKTETIDLSSFSLKHEGRNYFMETFIREKAGFTQTTTQTVRYFIKINFVSLSINQD